MSNYREESLEEIAELGEDNLISYIEYLEHQLETKDGILQGFISNLDEMRTELKILANEGIDTDEIEDRFVGPIKKSDLQ